MTNAEEKISAFQKFGWKLGLERMRALCSLLGEPQDSLNVIHVAGTNGKGSVCRYLYEVLLAHGHSVGLFTSPGLGDFRSRIESNGEWIADGDLENCTDRVMAAVGKMSDNNSSSEPPTEFEVLTAVALVYFESKKLDFVILEVGLGGALDSTNVITKPLVSVITEIGLDHTDYLGDTIEKIAAEKAGIIKSGCAVVTSASGEAARAVAKRAYELGSPLVNAHARMSDRQGTSGMNTNGEQGARGIECRVITEGLGGTVFSCEIHGTRYDNIEITMPGRHQVRNAVCALAAFDVLRHGYGILAEVSCESYPVSTDEKEPPITRRNITLRSDSDALRKGMKTARLPGRFDIISEKPLVILDGAHNAAGAAALRAAVDALMPGSRIITLIAMMRDKQTDDILKEIQEFASGAIFTEASNERSMSAGELALRWHGGAASVVRDTRRAFDEARAMVVSGEYDALIVCGSLYLISDIIVWLSEQTIGTK